MGAQAEEAPLLGNAGLAHSAGWRKALLLPGGSAPSPEEVKDAYGAGHIAVVIPTARCPALLPGEEVARVTSRGFVPSVTAPHSHSSSSSRRACRSRNYREMMSPQLKPS